MQEPAFKNVVVLYRRKVAASPQRKSEYVPIRSHNLVRPLPPIRLSTSVRDKIE